DLNGVEGIDFNGKGGADRITVGDLSGTGVQEVNLDLGGQDGAADNVIVQGTQGDDVVSVTGDANSTTVQGLSAQINITGAEAANDRLTINAGDGDDVVTASGQAAGAISLTANGENGNDILIGGAASNVLNGGAGDDVLFAGPGTTSLDGGPGNN